MSCEEFDPLSECQLIGIDRKGHKIKKATPLRHSKHPPTHTAFFHPSSLIEIELVFLDGFLIDAATSFPRITS